MRPIVDVLHRRSAGLDVHKRTVVACIRSVDAEGTVHKQIRTFGTMTADLLELADWLDAEGCRHGIDRRLLEADLAHPRGPVRADPGQRPPHEAGPRSKDRRQGRRVDRAT